MFAEWWGTGEEDEARRWQRKSLGVHDFAEAAIYAFAAGGRSVDGAHRVIDEATARATRVLGARWGAVEELANELMEHGELWERDTWEKEHPDSEPPPDPDPHFRGVSIYLDEALAEGNGEKAVRLYWDLIDQAYGKTAQQVEVTAVPDYSDVPTEELERQLAELRERLELPEKAA